MTAVNGGVYGTRVVSLLSGQDCEADKTNGFVCEKISVVRSRGNFITSFYAADAADEGGESGRAFMNIVSLN